VLDSCSIVQYNGENMGARLLVKGSCSVLIETRNIYFHYLGKKSALVLVFYFADLPGFSETIQYTRIGAIDLRL